MIFNVPSKDRQRGDEVNKVDDTQFLHQSDIFRIHRNVHAYGGVLRQRVTVLHRTISTIFRPPSLDSSLLTHQTNFLFPNNYLVLDSVAFHSFNQMVDASGLTASVEFEPTTADFIAWFTAANGSRISRKVWLSDLRAQNAGRGVGKLVPTETVAIA